MTIDEFDDPVPGPRHLLARPLACGICGSDLHMVHNGSELFDLHREASLEAPHSPLRGPALDPAVPVVLGHEFSAEVVQVGSAVDNFAVGDRVVSMPGLLATDGSIHTLGFSPSYPGGFSELMLIESDLAIPFGPDLEPSVAALTEPLAVALHAVNRAAVQPGQPVVVVGCGPVGLAIILQLRAAGFDRIVGADLSPSRRALAESLGAHEVLDPTEASPTAAAAKLGELPPVIFEAVGVPGVMDQIAMDAVTNSHVVVVGACLEADRWRPMLALARELTISFALAYTAEEFAETLKAIERGRIDPRPLITSVVPLSEAPDAFQRLRQAGPVKILVET